MEKLEFLKQGLKHMKDIGALAPTSKYASKAMLKHIDFQKAKIIVEYGAGDGVITKHILNAMQADAKLLAFEINPVFCEQLRKIKDNRLIIIEDSAEKLPDHLAEQNATEADYILSALPITVLPKAVVKSILNTSWEYLAYGGNYIQINYSWLANRLYKSVFGDLNYDLVVFNFPPALISVGTKS